MHMNSRVWLSLSPEAKEQYRRWFGVIDVDYGEKAKQQVVHAQEQHKPLRRPA